MPSLVHLSLSAKKWKRVSVDKWPGDLLKDESDLLTAKQEAKGAKDEDEEEMEEEEKK